MHTLLRRAALLTALVVASPVAFAQHHLVFTSQEDDKVIVPLPAPTGAYTLEAWVRYIGGSNGAWLGGYNTIMEWGDDDLFFGAGQSGELLIYGGTSSTAQLPRNQWRHVAATWDGNTLRLYIGGQLVASNPGTSGLKGPVSELGIGHHAGDTGWQGQIDEIMVWNTARTPAQLQVDAAGATPASASGLRLWMRFNEGQGQTVTTSAGSVNVVGMLGSTLNTDLEDPAWVTGGAPLAAPQLTAEPATRLEGAYPNPARDLVTVPFSLTTAGAVSIDVCDALGRAVQKVMTDELRPAGPQRVQVETATLPAGCYTVRLQTASGALRVQRLVVSER